MDAEQLIRRFLPLLAVVAAMAAFQTGAAAAKQLFDDIGPQGAASLRLLLGAGMLGAVTRPWRAWPSRAPVGSLLALGAAMVGGVLFFYLAMGRLPLGVTIALQFLGPLAVAVAGSRKASHLLWAVLAAAGVWSLVGAGQPFGRIDLVGVGWALAAGTCWAAYILLGQKVSAAFGNATAALAAGVAGLIALPFGIAQAGAGLISPAILPWALLVALLSTAIPFSLEFYALPRVPARSFAVFTSIEPAFAVMSGFLFLGERLSPAQLAGVAAVTAAAAGAAWSSAGRGHAAITDGPPD